jgi:hypothetical protein
VAQIAGSQDRIRLLALCIQPIAKCTGLSRQVIIRTGSERVPSRTVGELQVANVGSKSQTDP